MTTAQRIPQVKKIVTQQLHGLYPLTISNNSVKIPKFYRDKLLEDVKTTNDISIVLIYWDILKNAHHARKECGHLPILEQIEKIIPQIYIGCSKNRDKFMLVIRKILSQSKNECIYLTQLWQPYDYKTISWLDNVADKKYAAQLLLYFNRQILDDVIKPYIAHIYHVEQALKSHKVEFHLRSKWQKFLAKAMNSMLKCENPKLTVTDLDEHPNCKGILRIVPKSSCDDFRPILTLAHHTDAEKKYFKDLGRKIRMAAGKQYTHAELYESWITFVQLNISKGIYGVKMDLLDAFGSVDTNIVLEIVRNCDSLTHDEKSFIINHIQDQHVRIKWHNKSIYKWNRGLLQGDRLSASLCELYITHMEMNFIRPSIPKDTYILHRTVDDYFFCCLSESEAFHFLLKVHATFSVNLDKTKRRSLVDQTTHFDYAGRTFNLVTGDVHKLYKFDQKFPIRHKFRLMHTKTRVLQKNSKEILSNGMTYCYLGYYFTKFELNTVVNSEKTVVENVFCGFIYVAFKFDSAVMAIKDYQTDYRFLIDQLKYIIGKYSVKIYRKICFFKGINFKFMDYQLVVNTARHAFLLVFKLRGLFYKDAIHFLKNQRNIDKKISNEMHLQDIGMEISYFKKMPECFKHVSMNRSPPLNI